MKKIISVVFTAVLSLAVLSLPQVALACPQCPNWKQRGDLQPPWPPRSHSTPSTQKQSSSSEPDCPRCLACPSRLERKVRAAKKRYDQLGSRRSRHLDGCDKAKARSEKRAKIKLAHCLHRPQLRLKQLERYKTACLNRNKSGTKGDRCWKVYNKAAPALREEARLCNLQKQTADQAAKVAFGRCQLKAPHPPKKALTRARKRWKRLHSLWVRAINKKLKEAQKLSPP